MAKKKITVFLTLPSGDKKKHQTYEGTKIADFLAKEDIELVKQGKFILRKKDGEVVPRSEVECFLATEGLHLELLRNIASAAPPMPEPAGPAMKGKEYL